MIYKKYLFSSALNPPWLSSHFLQFFNSNNVAASSGNLRFFGMVTIRRVAGFLRCFRVAEEAYRDGDGDGKGSTENCGGMLMRLCLSCRVGRIGEEWVTRGDFDGDVVGTCIG